MKGTIYKIESKVNNKIYIGMTTRDIKVRWREHRIELSKNYHHNIKLQNHYNKYGDVFEYSIIEEVYFKGDEILNIESRYIKIYDTVRNGFNISSGGMGCLGYISKDRAMDNSQAQYVKNLSFFKIYEYYKLEEDLGVDRHILISIANEKTYKNIKIKFNDYNEYLWYQKESEKYRLRELGEKIKSLYNYYLDNEDATTVPRHIRKVIRPESIKNSLLRDDYEYKSMCEYIINRNERDRKNIEKKKEEECENILSLLLKYNNSEKVSEILNINVEKVRRVRTGDVYKKYCPRLREEVLSSCKILKSPPPDHEEFREYILNNTYVDAEKHYGVSRPTIKRWLDIYNIEKPLEYHNKNKKNPNGKLEKEDVINIREKYDSNKKTRRELATDYNLSYSQIDRIVRRIAYKNI